MCPIEQRLLKCSVTQASTHAANYEIFYGPAEAKYEFIQKCLPSKLIPTHTPAEALHLQYLSSIM
jgi:hypothetical protein